MARKKLYGAAATAHANKVARLGVNKKDKKNDSRVRFLRAFNRTDANRCMCGSCKTTRLPGPVRYTSTYKDYDYGPVDDIIGQRFSIDPTGNEGPFWLHRNYASVASKGHHAKDLYVVSVPESAVLPSFREPTDQFETWKGALARPASWSETKTDWVTALAWEFTVEKRAAAYATNNQTFE